MAILVNQKCEVSCMEGRREAPGAGRAGFASGYRPVR